MAMLLAVILSMEHVAVLEKDVVLQILSVMKTAVHASQFEILERMFP